MRLFEFKPKKLSAVIILGNPKYINNRHARQYYRKIEKFLKSHMVDVSFDPGNDYTCPKKADFYIGHSRGASRIICFKDTPQYSYFLRFGDIGGYIHPVDEKWQKENPPNQTEYNPPPKEHFVFTKDQKDAILKTIKKLRKDY